MIECICLYILGIDRILMMWFNNAVIFKVEVRQRSPLTEL